MPTKKKRKAVRVGSTPVTPVTAKEHRRIGLRIRAHHQKLRRRFKEVYGKKVDWISHAVEDGTMYFTVRFIDSTAFHLQVRSELVIDGIELSDWKTGNDKILRTYYRRKI